MNDPQPAPNEALAHSLRGFLKTVGVGSQRGIEAAIAQALADGRIAADARFPALATVRVPALGLELSFEAELRLGD